MNNDDRFKAVEEGLQGTQKEVAVLKSQFEGFKTMEEQNHKHINKTITGIQDDIRTYFKDLKKEMKEDLMTLDKRNMKWNLAFTSFLVVVIGILLGIALTK